MKKSDKLSLSHIAYSISIPFGQTLHVKRSANAWWMDQQKLHNLIAIFQIAGTIEEACLYAGITVKQYKYFVSLHPEFHQAREGYTLIPNMKARKVIIDAINRGDLKMCMWYLEKHEPATYGSPSRRRMESIRKQRQLTKQGPLSKFNIAVKRLTEEYEEKLRELIVSNI